MTWKRILIRLVVWAAVLVAHYFATGWVFDYVLLRGPKWVDYAVAYGLFWPADILRWFGIKVYLHDVGRRILHSALWTATLAGTFEGARWLWAIRPGRRRPFSRQRPGPGPTG